MQVNNEQGSLSTAEKTSRLEADLSSLKPFPGNLGCFEVYEYIVDKWSTISMKNVHYSVPDSLVGRKKYMSRFIVKKNRHPAREGESGLSSTQLLRWRLVHQAGALFAYTFPVNRGHCPPLCGLAKSTGRTEKAV